MQDATWLTALYGCLSERPWAETVADRLKEIGWVLDYLDDLDADFLAIYGIDLTHTEISSRRYFALAQRLTAYSGVMAARLEAERDDRPATSTRTSSTPATSRDDSSVTELSLTQFRAKFPHLVSVTRGG
ncbi:hypothetical protein [Streptomyces turgidiscabies]|uniref:hypothetical protein n=1 Tax=Streptomyces turgidiscabies TaxID=85558 RepID=UPI0038F73015